MFLRLLILLISFLIIHGRHFNGGTITWCPVNPSDNSSSVDVTITQSYAWAYPIITCATDVPITTSGRSTQSSNLSCVVDCLTDGGYSTKPINTLTDCTSVSSSLGMMNSERSHNISLTAGAHFYLAYVGSAWVALNDPAQSGLQWSIVTFIDLRMRPDGFINTPPTTSVVSPQYAIVNNTIQINIPVSDVNAGDDVRCRWSTFTAGYRRRKRSDSEEHINQQSAVHFYKQVAAYGQIKHIRGKRGSCPSKCESGDSCSHSHCVGTTCIYPTCSIACCDPASATIMTTTSATSTTTASTTVTQTTTTTTVSTSTDSTTTIVTTTIDTPGTLKSTSSYPHRQAIDECGGICYPGSVPNSTTLSNCTITFTGLKAGTWYAVAVQVEDFINNASNIPMSSVPVQFLIYVLPQPTCSEAPVILSVNGCLEVQVGVSVLFNLFAMNLCNSSVVTLTDIVVSSGITGMSAGNLTNSLTNSSLSYVTFTWTPLANQVGSQQLCTIAFTSEKLQSNQYCVTFTVKTSSDLCVTTTTTSTTTTTETTTTTSKTTTSTSTSTTSVTTTTTSETSTSTTTSSTSTSSTTSISTTSTSTSSTSTSTSTTTSSTSTTSTSTSSTSTSTSTTTSSTSTTSTSTSTTTSSTSTTTTSVTTTTSTSTTTTTATTTTITTATTTTKSSGKSTNWLLILGLSLLGLLLALCCSCCCLYWALWSPAARRRRQKTAYEDSEKQTVRPRSLFDDRRNIRDVRQICDTSTSIKDYLVKNSLNLSHNINNNSLSNIHISFADVNALKSATAITDAEKHIVSSTVSVRKIRRNRTTSLIDTETSNETENINIKPSHRLGSDGITPTIQNSPANVRRWNKASSLDETYKGNSNTPLQKTLVATPTVQSKAGRVNVIKVPRNKRVVNLRPKASSVGDIVSTINLDKSSIEMRPMVDLSKTNSLAAERKTNTGSGVIVTKLPRELTSSQSRRS